MLLRRATIPRLHTHTLVLPVNEDLLVTQEFTPATNTTAHLSEFCFSYLPSFIYRVFSPNAQIKNNGVHFYKFLASNIKTRT